MNMSRLIIGVTALWLTAFALPALALELGEARSKGLVGEKLDGYVAAIGGGEAQQLAAKVNAGRRAEYERISKQNGQPVDIVAKLAAEQIIQKLPSGAMYQDASGGWKKR